MSHKNSGKKQRGAQAKQQSVLLVNSVDTLSRLARARDFMKAAHGSQTRKHTGEPYWHHPDAVAKMVAEVGGSEDMVIAALLHDVVEDTSVPLSEIESEFGSVVASLVEQLTDVSKPSDGNRIVRKAFDLIHTQDASPEAHTIKLTDILDNLLSIIVNDPQFATVYVHEKMFLSRVLQDGNRTLLSRLQDVFAEYALAHPDMQDVYDTVLESEGIWTPRHRERRL
jgi:(p)ppGpp synthase/HD superfamily hydrolase